MTRANSLGHRPALALLATSALLAGCASGSGDATAGTTPSATTSTTATPSPTPTLPASVECLESGTWVVDNARDAELFAEGLRTAASDVGAERTGDAVYEFADGVLTRTFTGWRLTFSALLMGHQVTESTTLDGATTASYEVTETDVVTEAADVSALVVDVVVTQDGAPVTFDDPGSSAREGESSPESWGFTCDGDTLLLADRAEDGTLAEGSGSILLHRR